MGKADLLAGHINKHGRKNIPGRTAATPQRVRELEIENEKLRVELADTRNKLESINELDSKIKEQEKIITDLRAALKSSKSSNGSELQTEVDALKNKIKLLEQGVEPLTKNEEKILNAIRVEAFEQDTEWPQITQSMFRKKHKVHPNYFRSSIQNLTKKGLIKKKSVAYIGNIETFKYRLSNH